MKKIEFLEKRLAMVENKMKTNKNKRFEKILAVLRDSKNEIQNRLAIESRKLSIVEQKSGDIEKYGDINPFDFNNINQLDNEKI